MLIDFLEFLIPLWLLLLFIVVFGLLFYSHNVIRKYFSFIKRRHLFVLFFIFRFAFGVRLAGINAPSLIKDDSMEMSATAGIMAEYGRFKYLDVPGMPFLNIIPTLLLGIHYSTSSITNIIFSSLSIMMIFFFVSAYSKSSRAGLYASVILAASTLYYETSLSGITPIATSLFFVMACLILLKIHFDTGDKRILIALGLLVGFTMQIYLYEIILVPIVLLFLLIRKKRIIPHAFIFLILVFAVVFPYFLYQNIFFPVVYHKEPSYNLVVIYMGQKSTVYGGGYESFKESYLGENTTLGVVKFLFLGKDKSLLSNYKPYRLSYWNNYGESSSIFNKFSILSITVSLLALFSFRKRYSLIFAGFGAVLLLVFLIDTSATVHYLMPALVIGLIPLASIGLLEISRFDLRIPSIILSFLILLFLMSGFVRDSYELSIYKDAYSAQTTFQSQIYSARCANPVIYTGSPLFFMLCSSYVSGDCEHTMTSELHTWIESISPDYLGYENYNDNQMYAFIDMNKRCDIEIMINEK